MSAQAQDTSAAAPASPAARQAQVSRGTKVAFAALVVLGLSGVVAAKAWQVYYEPELETLRYLGVDPMVGPAPAFQLQARDGRMVSLADWRGKTVLLNFWATWCDSCKVEMPSMRRLAQALRGEPFVMVAASVDEGWEPIDRFLREKPEFEVLLDVDGKWARTFGTVKFPETYVIGPDGRYRGKFVGPRDWSDKAFEGYFRRMTGAAQAPGGRPAK